ncbi:efflux RND transporter periplasmic adaptor subunit [Microvirga puerhi]|uniref:Efflux RND transporter periplasmic adaptor subunit n=1 Tax=Microvirga puerhi TaxID=2876078 RepID=A0ABS7VR59_9HYPH|nr:efflux RND transporter periplasmic adaptor subunit [Microvirga puerhi]MBZ6078014.1 efflux RND transporter periplasmic adaptor subunit [Microvirga puerhi]
MTARRGTAWTAMTLVLLCAGCGAEAPEEAEPIRPVRTISVQPGVKATPQTFSGRIAAQDHPTLAFRIGGRVAERPVDVGMDVKQGQVIARLDPENELNALRSARAALADAEGALRRADGQLQRQSHLRDRGVATRADFETAEQARRAAAARVEAALAQLRIAEDLVGFTILEADAPGNVTAVSAEPGEVVAPGQPVVRLARREGRDAVFEVPAEQLAALDPDADILVTGGSDNTHRAVGRVREVSPEADPVTRTFTISVGLADPPPTFLIGTSVTLSVAGAADDSLAIPATALTDRNGTTGAWVADPEKGTVSFRPLQILRRNAATAAVGRGLVVGDIVVTAGAGQLREGQKVRLIGRES